MAVALYTEVLGEDASACPLRNVQAQRWLTDLPQDLQAVVVAPVSIDVYQEYEMQAERAQGRDAANALCFSEFQYVLTQLRCDDDDIFYESVEYAEILTSWRLLDERWLVCKTTKGRATPHGIHTTFSISDRMPR